MKKVCFVCDGIWEQLQGGAEYQLHIQSRALSERGYAVYYVYTDRGTPIDPGPVHLVPLWLPNWIRRFLYPYHALLLPQLLWKLYVIKPDVVINRVASAMTGGIALYGRAAKTRTIWHVANVTDLLPPKLKLDRTYLMRWIDRKIFEYGMRNVTDIVAQADYQAELLRTRYGLMATKVISNAHPSANSEVACTSLEPLKNVLWVANIKPKKRPEAFIALAGAFAARNDVRFLMIGRPDEGAYQRTVDTLLDSATNVDYLGELPIDEVNRLLANALLLVNTSEVEGFPNTFIQAWMRGVPVVSLSFDPDNVLRDKALGLISGRFDRLVDDVGLMIDDAEQRSKIGDRAKRYALETHGLTRNIDRMISIIEDQT